MNILFSHYAIIDKQGFGRTFMLARELVANGNELTFLTSLPANKFKFPYYYEKRDGVHIYAFPDIVPDFMRRTGFGVLSTILKLFFIISRKFEIYHSDAGHRLSGGVPILIKKLFNRNLVYVCEWWDYFGKGGQYDTKSGFKKYTHGTYDLYFEIYEKKLANGVVCLSHGMLERAIQNKVNSNLIVINGGADTKSIKFFATNKHKKKFGITENSFTFGFIGMNNGEFHDIEPFVSSIRNLRKDGLQINWFTTGQKLSPKTKSTFQIEDELKEFGWVDYQTYSEVLSCADAFVLLQQENLMNYTRWPNKLGDYMAAGRPVLVNSFGEIKLYINRFKGPFFVVNPTLESISQQIKHLINYHQYNPDSVIKLRKHIRYIAVNELDWNLKAIQLEQFYKKIS